MKGKTHDLNHDLTFYAHTFNCVCHSIRSMFRVLGIYNFASDMKIAKILVQNTTGLENSNHVFNLSYFAFKKSYITSICAPVNNGILVMC